MLEPGNEARCCYPRDTRRSFLMTDETLCQRNGRCCQEKIKIGEVVVTTDVPCRYLDENTRLCTVYNLRHDAHVRCLTVEEGIVSAVFPPYCPYMRHVAGYRGTISLEDAAGLFGMSREELNGIARQE